MTQNEINFYIEHCKNCKESEKYKVSDITGSKENKSELYQYFCSHTGILCSPHATTEHPPKGNYKYVTKIIKKYPECVRYKVYVLNNKLNKIKES